MKIASLEAIQAAIKRFEEIKKQQLNELERQWSEQDKKTPPLQ